MVSRSGGIVIVEGGGNDNASLQAECRRSFSKFFASAGFSGRLPRIVVGGGRSTAFRKFCTAIMNQENRDLVFLLVDAEEQVNGEDQPWEHVKTRRGDGWDCPEGATDNSLHLMVQCMESWFLADRNMLREYFGQGFNENALPTPSTPIESIRKDDLFRRLENATRGTKTVPHPVLWTQVSTRPPQPRCTRSAPEPGCGIPSSRSATQHCNAQRTSLRPLSLLRRCGRSARKLPAPSACG